MTTPPKKSRTQAADFSDARKACRTPEDHEHLASIIKAGWTPAELHEYARLYHFKNGRDYPTPASYLRAIYDVAHSIKWHPDMEPCYHGPVGWQKIFRKGKSKPLPPRREGLLQRGRGLAPLPIDCEEYAWPGHTEEYRSMIEQRCRDYFKIPPEQPVHVNAWAASQRAYDREQAPKIEAERRAREAATLYLTPKSKKRSAKKAHEEDVAAFDYCAWGKKR